MIRIALHGTDAFEAERARLKKRGAQDLSAVEPTVRRILGDVRQGGDEAVLRLSLELDGQRPEPLFRRQYDGEGALARLEPGLRKALERATERIARFHERQRIESFRYHEDGIELGTRVRPVARAGVYAPAGKARYPSSVLMSAIPARVAGVPEIILATLAPDDLIYAAAHLAGVTAILDAGGAQAIAALAYGTESVPKVDKIVGPGNRYVACAKRLVFGEVGIDSIAGPSEILVVCDSTARADWVAADLLSQAEHDEAAYPLCVTTDARLATDIAEAIETRLERLPKRAIARASVDQNGAILVVSCREDLASVAGEIASEHVALHVDRPTELFEQIGAMGAGFIGAYTPEASGDYLAGPSHVLPTGGAARHSSPLGVYDFVARSSFIAFSPGALAEQGPFIAELARAEGLEAHARAVEARTGTPPGRPTKS